MTDILDQIYSIDSNADRYDRYLFTVCPFHTSYPIRPSLQIYPDWFRCLSCDRQGRPEQYLAHIQSYSFIPKKVEHKPFQNPFRDWLKGDSLSNVLRLAHRNIQSNPSLMSYLRKRGLSEQTVKETHIGYLGGFYLIPIVNESGYPISAFARAGESIKKARYFVPDGSDPNLLYAPSWSRIKESREVYLTYGSFDTLALHELGYAAMSTTSGQKISPRAFDKIRKNIKIWPDAGEIPAAMKLASQLGWRADVHRYRFPEGTKDVSDLHVTNQLINAI